MNVREALGIQSLRAAQVVAGACGLDRDVRWAHVIDMPDPVPWVRAGQLLLTTGFAWPADEAAERSQVRLLSEKGLAAMALAVPGYFAHFTAAARDEADRSGLPLLEIPFEVPFAQITEELHRAIIAEQYSLIERSEEIHRALTRAAASGSDLNDLASALGESIRRSVIFEDAGGKVLAYYLDGQHRDDARNEALETALGKPRVVRAIRLGSELVGLACIVEGDTPLSELDNRAADHAALVGAVHLAHQRELTELESRLGYASFLSLLEAEDDDAQAVERARLLGFDPDVLHRVGIAVIPGLSPLSREGFVRRERIALLLRTRLHAAGVRPLLTTSLNRISFLIPESVVVEPIWGGLGDPDIRFVLGRAYAGTQGVRRSYREAQSLLSHPAASVISRFEDALIHRILMGDEGARSAFIGDLFGRLDTRKGGETLKRALLALAGSGFNFGRTAKGLGIHPNTLRYRLARAVEATGLDLDDSEVRFRLELAVRVLEFADE